MSFELSEPVKAAVRTLAWHTSVWEPALTADGELREGAAVAEATGMADLSEYPAGSRLIIRREPLHPGAQQTLDDIDGYRFTALLTDQPGADIAALEQRHRARARAEDRIRNLKDLGMGNLPCDDYDRNAVWLQLALTAMNLQVWTQTLTLDGELARAEPKRLRYQLLHVAARVVRSGRRTTLRLARDWPWTGKLLAAFQRLRALPPAPA